MHCPRTQRTEEKRRREEKACGGTERSGEGQGAKGASVILVTIKIFKKKGRKCRKLTTWAEI